jgi:hypothetical protein
MGQEQGMVREQQQRQHEVEGESSSGVVSRRGRDSEEHKAIASKLRTGVGGTTPLSGAFLCIAASVSTCSMGTLRRWTGAPDSAEMHFSPRTLLNVLRPWFRGVRKRT